MADTELTDKPVEEIRATESEPEPDEEIGSADGDDEGEIKPDDQIHG